MPVPPWLYQRLLELKIGVAFLTRLPVSNDAPTADGELAQALWTAPLVGVVVGLIGAVVYGLAYTLNVPALLAATLAVAATVAVTGCLHEDGLADVADGFGGGATRERKLEIMRDSRIGTYGVCVLVLTFVLRISVLASLSEPTLVTAALVASHAAARAVIPAFMLLVPAARSDGLSATAGQPPSGSAAAAAAIGIAALVLCIGLKASLLALLPLACGFVFMVWLCQRHIQGQTGDVLGALEQVGEMIVLLVAAAAMRV